MWPFFNTILTIDDLVREFWHNPTVFFGLIYMVLAAISFPFLIALSFRAWRYLQQNAELKELKAKNQKLKNKQNEEFSKLPGEFNSAVIEKLHLPLNENIEGELEKVELVRDNKKASFSETESTFTEEKVLSANKKPAKAEKTAKKSVNITEPDKETKRVFHDLSQSGLHGKLATAQLRAKTAKLEQSMSDAEREKENEIRRSQLEAIFQMMKDQGDKFGLEKESDLVEQLKLYSV